VNVSTPERERIAVDGVEWLAALWELTAPGPSRSANPHLVEVLRLEPRLLTHPACRLVSALRQSTTRDRLVKQIVTGAYTTAPADDELAAAVHAFAREVAECWGTRMADFIANARAAAVDRAARLAGPLDAVEPLAELTGERLPFRAVLAPSVFLPVPQTGRHGALLHLPAESVAHLHFGFPVHGGESPFSFTREWFLGGAWHYAIQTYLARYWPPVARRLSARRDVMRALLEVLRSVPSRRGPMGDTEVLEVMAVHVNFVMKGALYRGCGLRDDLVRALANAEGFILFSWVEAWLLDGLGGATLPAHLLTLPDALAAAQAQWQDLRFADVAAPPTGVHIALTSVSARSATFVVPDEWSDAASTAAMAGWDLLSLPRLRYSEWCRVRERDANPVIAFGEPERNDLVRGVLEQRGLSLARVHAHDPAIIALSKPGFEGHDWCLAVAVTRPETAALLHIEMAFARPRSYIVCDGQAVIAPDSLADGDDMEHARAGVASDRATNG
jgi:hypothetical protein